MQAMHALQAALLFTRMPATVPATAPIAEAMGHQNSADPVSSGRSLSDPVPMRAAPVTTIAMTADNAPNASMYRCADPRVSGRRPAPNPLPSSS